MVKRSVIWVLGRLLLSLAVLALLVPAVCSEEKVLSIRSDSSWKDTGTVSGTDWIQPSFDDSSWGSSTGNWNNSPCSVNCGKIASCSVGCNEWMWTPTACENCTSYFRKSFSLEGEIVSGTITISADDYYWLYVNGNLIGTSEAKKVSYALSDNYDITRYLHNGVNVIAIKVENKNGFEGVVVRSEIRYQTADPLIAQLQSQVSTLQLQISKLTDDKTRLEGQVDSLQKDNAALASSKDQLQGQVSGLQLEMTNLKTTLEDTESNLSRYKLFTVGLVLVIVVVLAGLALSIHHIIEKSKKKQPSISALPKQQSKDKKSATIERRMIEQTPPEGQEPELPHKKSVNYESLREEGRSSGSKLFP